LYCVGTISGEQRPGKRLAPYGRYEPIYSTRNLLRHAVHAGRLVAALAVVVVVAVAVAVVAVVVVVIVVAVVAVAVAVVVAAALVQQQHDIVVE
jgi:hypothetical protein